MAATAAQPAAPATAAPVLPVPAEAPPSDDTAPKHAEETPAPGSPSDIVVTARVSIPGDPAAELNAVSYQVVQAVDDNVIAPIAHGYEAGVPSPVRSGIANVINNLDEPIVFINFVLQLKFGKAAETLARFAINSTVGIAGLVDVAKRKPFNLPRRSNGLADTLGYYGIGPGPYLFLPLIGATTVRDMLGRIVDLSILPAVGKPFNKPVFALAKGTLSSLTERVERDDLLAKIKESPDPYVAMRTWYLRKRKAEIDVLKGRCVSIDAPPCSDERAAP